MNSPDWRGLLRRWLPNSLFGRLMVVVLGSLLLAQLLGGWLLFQSWGTQTLRHQGRYLGQRIVDIRQALRQLPPEQHATLLTALRSPRLHVHLASEPPRPCATSAPPLPLPRNLERYLRRTLPGEVFCFQVQQPDAHTLEVRAAVAVTEDTWLWVDHLHRPGDNGNWPWRLSLHLLLMLGLIAISSWFAVRWFTLPLSELARAAERLGHDMDQPPLREHGARETRQAARAFNRMQGRLRRYLADRTRMLSAVSHDLKTPLTRMRLRAELVEDEELRESLCRDLDEMQAMTLATLDFLRGLEELEPLGQVEVTTLLESLHADAEDMGWPVTLEIPEPLPVCWLRVNSVKRCINNLIENGVKYGGAVTVRATLDGEILRIEIQDQGAGIPESCLETVFDPFFRLEDSRSRQTGGTGLGLSIARNLARAHGGDTLLCNAPEGGLRAVLALPLRQDLVADSGSSSRSAPGDQGG